VTAKELQHAKRRGSARPVEPEPACDVRLERRAEAILGATDEEVQMTPHKRQKVMRFHKRRIREHCGST
jgi:hypothetical protein